MEHGRIRRTLHVALALALCVGISWSSHEASATADDDTSVGRAPALNVQHKSYPGAGMGGPVRPARIRPAYVSGLMTYHGGRVLHSSRVHAVFWDPGALFGADYINKIIRFFNDVAADSLTRTNVYATVKEYADSSGFATKYKVTQPKTCHSGIGCFKAWAFSNVYPNDCPAGAANPCVSDTAMRGFVDAVHTFLSIPTGGNDITFVFLPAGVNTCFGSSCFATPDFCAYHSSFDAGSGTQLYANMPFNFTGSVSGCEVAQYPNNSQADAEFNSLSHEHLETITDPVPGTGWFNGDLAHENGDQCAYTFSQVDQFGYAVAPGTGNLHGVPGKYYNQKINGHKYFMQEEWSNKKFTNTFGAVGCVQHK